MNGHSGSIKKFASLKMWLCEVERSSTCWSLIEIASSLFYLCYWTKIRVCIRKQTHCLMWDVITYPCASFNKVLTKPLLKLWHRRIISLRCCLSSYLFGKKALDLNQNMHTELNELSVAATDGIYTTIHMLVIWGLSDILRRRRR